MANVDGSWDCTVKSPLGDQKLTLTIRAEGAGFTGTASGAMGSADVSGTRSTMPSLVAVAWTSIPYRSRAFRSTASAQGASTPEPSGQWTQTRQSPSSSRNRSNTTVVSVGRAPVACCCSAR